MKTKLFSAFLFIGVLSFSYAQNSSMNEKLFKKRFTLEPKENTDFIALYKNIQKIDNVTSKLFSDSKMDNIEISFDTDSIQLCYGVSNCKSCIYFIWNQVNDSIIKIDSTNIYSDNYYGKDDSISYYGTYLSHYNIKDVTVKIKVNRRTLILQVNRNKDKYNMVFKISGKNRFIIKRRQLEKYWKKKLRGL